MVYSPGCALMLYAKERAQAMLKLLGKECGVTEMLHTCCHHKPQLPQGSCIINTCAGCDKRFSALYEGISTVSLWEVLAKSKDFPFPDYGGQIITVLDACPTRHKDNVHEAVRQLLQRMNVVTVEPQHTKRHGKCCGDSFYGKLPIDQVKERMSVRAQEMPVDDVVVYCVSCCNSMFIGGKRPRYLVDLLLGEPTTPGIIEPAAWHESIKEYISSH